MTFKLKFLLQLSKMLLLKGIGEVTVTLQSDSNIVPTYQVSNSLNSATVAVLDQSITTISITAGDAIIEGSVAEFIISANAVRTRDISINYSVSDGVNNFLTFTQSETGVVILPAGRSSQNSKTPNRYGT